MTNEEALKVLEDATASMMGTRTDHQIVGEALVTLRAALEAAGDDG